MKRRAFLASIAALCAAGPAVVLAVGKTAKVWTTKGDKQLVSRGSMFSWEPSPHDGTTYWMSNDKFYAYTTEPLEGGSYEEIGRRYHLALLKSLAQTKEEALNKYLQSNVEWFIK